MGRFATNNYEDRFFEGRLTQATTRAEARWTNNEDFNLIVQQFNESGPHMGKFDEDKGGIYPQEEIMSDAKWAKQFAERHDFESTQAKIEEAVAAENIFLEGVYSYEWFGPEVVATNTTRYDDYKSGIDAVVVHHDDDENIDFALGVDITVSSDPDVIDNKLAKSVEAVHHTVMSQDDAQKALHHIKYFKDPETEKLGNLHVPRVVLAFDVEDTETLMKRFVEKDASIANDEIKKHLQYEVISQLEVLVAELIRKYLDNSFSTQSDDWQSAIETHEAKINDIPGLRTVFNAHTKPLTYFSKIYKEN
ncbi:MAG: hypothetical protein ACPGO5_03570 [Patescibacteria group bacterium]